jgi:hypothetical protein
VRESVDAVGERVHPNGSSIEFKGRIGSNDKESRPQQSGS